MTVGPFYGAGQASWATPIASSNNDIDELTFVAETYNSSAAQVGFRITKFQFPNGPVPVYMADFYDAGSLSYFFASIAVNKGW